MAIGDHQVATNETWLNKEFLTFLDSSNLCFNLKLTYFLQMLHVWTTICLTHGQSSYIWTGKCRVESSSLKNEAGVMENVHGVMNLHPNRLTWLGNPCHNHTVNVYPVKVHPASSGHHLQKTWVTCNTKGARQNIFISSWNLKSFFQPIASNHM